MALQLTLSRVFVADHFHAFPGFVEDRHGHNWELAVTVAQPEDGGAGLEALLERWLQNVDYRLLNACPELEGRNPTAEALAGWVFDLLQEEHLEPVRVQVREKAHYWAACLPGTHP